MSSREDPFGKKRHKNINYVGLPDPGSVPLVFCKRILATIDLTCSSKPALLLPTETKPSPRKESSGIETLKDQLQSEERSKTTVRENTAHVKSSGL